MATNRVNNFIFSLKDRQEAATASGMPVNKAPRNREADIDLFDPQALLKLGKLEVISQTVVDGMISGKHRSTHKGGNAEFSHLRPYVPGDDIRALDWKQYARSDRYYVRQYEDETNLQALLVVDASGSMRFGQASVSKWDYARMAAACMARLLMRQRDSVGLAVLAQQLNEFVRPLPRASHLARIMDTLGKATAGGPSVLADAVQPLIGRLTRRGMVMLFSDCFGDVEPLRQALQQYRIRGHEVIVFQTLAPEEQTFPFRRGGEFRDLESSRRLNIQPAEVRRQYLEKFNAFQAKLKASMSEAGIDLVTLSTDADLGDSLAHYLRKRAAMKMAGARV